MEYALMAQSSGKGRLVKACYHGSWTRPSEKADSELNGHTATEVECN